MVSAVILYERTGRMEEYKQMVERLHSERQQYFDSWPGLSDAVKNAV